MEVSMKISSEKARGATAPADFVISSLFSEVVTGAVSAQFVDLKGKRLAAGVCGLSFPSPIISVLLQEEGLYAFFETAFAEGRCVLFVYADNTVKAYTASVEAKVTAVTLSQNVAELAAKLIAASFAWGGLLNERGELTADLASPAPGVHYYTNLLIGNRIGFDKPLQSTPKSTIDRLGGGSFRSHADTQVLATR